MDGRVGDPHAGDRIVTVVRALENPAAIGVAELADAATKPSAKTVALPRIQRLPIIEK